MAHEQGVLDHLLLLVRLFGVVNCVSSPVNEVDALLVDAVPQVPLQNRLDGEFRDLQIEIGSFGFF